MNEDFGYRYLRGRPLQIDHQPWQKFLHGLIRHGEGTCCNLPVLYVAIAQRLGYPLGLALGPNHAFCRWEGTDGAPFNFEVTSEKGAVFLTHEKVVAARINRCLPSWRNRLFRTLSARELLGFFLALRADVFCAQEQYHLAAGDLYYALYLDPDNPILKQNLWANLQRQHLFQEAVETPEWAKAMPKLPPRRIILRVSEVARGEYLLENRLWWRQSPSAQP